MEGAAGAGDNGKFVDFGLQVGGAGAFVLSDDVPLGRDEAPLTADLPGGGGDVDDGAPGELFDGLILCLEFVDADGKFTTVLRRGAVFAGEWPIWSSSVCRNANGPRIGRGPFAWYTFVSLCF